MLHKVELIRSHAAVKMGLSPTADEATRSRPHTPKLACVASPVGYLASDGKTVDPSELDINARIFSMGKLHHAMTGTGAVAIAAAAAIPSTVVSRLLPRPKGNVRFGHPSGSLAVGAEVEQRRGSWVVTKVTMSRSARRIMEGTVLVPETAFNLDAPS